MKNNELIQLPVVLYQRFMLEKYSLALPISLKAELGRHISELEYSS